MTNLFILLENFTNGYKNSLIPTISFFCLFFALFVLVSKNPIVSVLFLISLFFSVSVYLITLGMHFIGLSYLLVYVGAISILFLFILMLINIRISELTTDNYNSVVLALIAGICFVIPVLSVMPSSLLGENSFSIDLINNFLFSNEQIVNYKGVEHWTNQASIFNGDNSNFWAFSNDQTASITGKKWDSNLNEISHIESIGNVMYTEWAIWLVIISLILLLAMVGAIVITIKR